MTVMLAVALVWLGRSGETVSEPEAVATDRASLLGAIEVSPEKEPIETGLSGLDLGDLIVAEVEDAEVVAELIRRLPSQKGTGQQHVVASHIANLTDSEDYAEIERLILDHDALESAALDVLLADLHLREESVKLPVFANVSMHADHPAFSEAFASLRTYFEERGEDLESWQAAAYAYESEEMLR